MWDLIVSVPDLFTFDLNLRPVSDWMSKKTLTPEIGSGSGWGTWLRFAIRCI